MYCQNCRCRNCKEQRKLSPEASDFFRKLEAFEKDNPGKDIIDYLKQHKN